MNQRLFQRTMVAVVKISDHNSFALTRESGDSLFKLISHFLSEHLSTEKIIVDFADIPDVSISFIQATILKLIDQQHQVELINLNKSIKFKISTLIRIARIDPSIFRMAESYPQSPVFV